MAKYQQRLKQISAELNKSGLDALFVRPSSDLEYLTGLQVRNPQLTTTHMPSDWLFGAVLRPGHKVTIICPHMAHWQIERKVVDKSWIGEVIIIPEHANSLEFAAQIIPKLGLDGLTVGIANHVWAETILQLKQLFPSIQFKLASELIYRLRMIKDDEEIALMTRAAHICDEVFEYLITFLKPGMSEYDVASEIDYQMGLRGADSPSFPTDITFKGNGGLTTGMDQGGSRLENKLVPGMNIAFDFGAVYQGYCSDFGRMIYCGEPDAELRKIHKLVISSQQAAIEAMQAGQITGSIADEICRRPIEEAGYGQYFYHRLGHAIGRDVHEPPFLTASEDTILQAGMLFTVEPSISIPNRCGSRVEDVVLVTPEGGRVLNTASKEIIVI